MSASAASARPLRLGTRASALALWQTERVRDALAAAGRATTRIEIRTTGDAVQDVPLSRIGMQALFTRQLDEALLGGRIDLAVHSLKDLPSRLPDGIALVAVSRREDPRDALVGRGPVGWSALPEGAVVATSSLRRRAQLLRARPDLRLIDLRGNVDTRLARLDASDWAAIVLATAGLVRLGFGHRIGERLPVDWMLPAPGQGALAVTARGDDAETAAAVRAAVHDEPTAVATAAERGFLRRLEGGCQVPIAAHAEWRDGRLALRGRVISLDGTEVAEGAVEASAPDPARAEAMGLALAEQVIAEGGDLILARVRAASGP